jgi:hypothetical protein
VVAVRVLCIIFVVVYVARLKGFGLGGKFIVGVS